MTEISNKMYVNPLNTKATLWLSLVNNVLTAHKNKKQICKGDALSKLILKFKMYIFGRQPKKIGRQPIVV